MDDKGKQELSWRRKALRLTLKGWRPCEILQRIPRGRTWLFRWQQRFVQEGWHGLQSRSRRPKRVLQEYPVQAHTVVIKVRQTSEKRPVGLIGARAVRHEIKRHKLLQPVPALATINRWLRAAGMSKAGSPAPPKVYFPQPTCTPEHVLHVLDWTARYLEGGEKVFVFHTVDRETHALVQTLSQDKTSASLQEQVLAAGQTLGLPHCLQLDNDAAFSGGERTPRRFGHFVRLCLYLGIELIFIPPREPKRNWLVEGLNGLWAKSFWNRHHFRSFTEVVRKSPTFTRWYAYTYCPPELEGLTPAQAHRRVWRQRLSRAQLHTMPPEVPLTAGRLHFIRRVSAAGDINFLGETWKVGKGLAHQYVWATVITHCRRLEIYHQRSAQAARRLVKTVAYEIPETVRRLRPEYRR
jgi:hypothetical protein